MPPPIEQEVDLAIGHRRRLPRRTRRRRRRRARRAPSGPPRPRVEHREDLVAGLEHGVGLGHEARALAQHRDQQAALGHLRGRRPAARRRRESSRSSISMISSRSSGRSSRWTRPYSGTSCSIRRRIRSVAETERLDPEQVEVLAVARVVDPGDDPVDQVLLLRDLADQHVVLVVAGDRDHHVGALRSRPARAPRARRRRRTGRCARAPARPSGSGRGSLSIRVTSLPFSSSSRARFQPTLPAPTMMMYMPLGHLEVRVLVIDAPPAAAAAALGGVADLALEHVDRDPGRADRVQALLARTTRPVAGRGSGRSPSAPRSGAWRSGR